MMEKERQKQTLFQEKEIHGSVQAFIDFVAFLEKKYPGSGWLPPQVYTWMKAESFRSKAITFLVEESGQTIAALIGSPYQDIRHGQHIPSFHANFLFVDPQFQNRGIASSLIDGLKQRYDSISLHVTPSGKDSSQRGIAELAQFYGKLGFFGYDEEGRLMCWDRSRRNDMLLS
jgi:GNAT superfamily N-acetyltransferase